MYGDEDWEVISQTVPNEKVPRAWNPRVISELLNDLVVIRDTRHKNSLVSRSAIKASKVLAKTQRRRLPSRENMVGRSAFSQSGCL